jgi:hypothetical protein
VPVMPSCLLEPAWVEFSSLTGGEPPGFHPGHPLGCHRRRVPGRVVFEHVVAALGLARELGRFGRDLARTVVVWVN